MRTLLLLLMLCGTAAAEVGSVDGNAPAVVTPAIYTVVAVKDDLASDPISADLVNGFKTNKDLIELRKVTKVFGYNESNPDWQRFAKMGYKAPCVVTLQGDVPIYRRHGAKSEQIAKDIGGTKLVEYGGRWRPFRPNCPDCVPKPDNPKPYHPVDPLSPQPNHPVDPLSPLTPTNPLQPLPDIPLEPEPAPVPPQPAEPDKTVVELKATVELLIKRIEVLEQLPPPKDGVDGKNGRDGKDGLNGKDGVNGKDGPALDQVVQQLMQNNIVQQVAQQVKFDQPALDLDLIATEISKRLKHSATITLLDGTTKHQTKPLSEPLEFIQHAKGVK